MNKVWMQVTKHRSGYSYIFELSMGSYRSKIDFKSKVFTKNYVLKLEN